MRGSRIVQLNRRTRATLDEAGVVQKFGVSPASIPDYLALVGDAADGYPGLNGWGAKSSAAVLAKFVHIESIPLDYREWQVNAASASALAATLSRERDRALLFRTLATLRTDIALFDDVDQLRWNGPTPGSGEYHFVTRKNTLLLSVPLGVFTSTVLVVAPWGTVVLIKEAEKGPGNPSPPSSREQHPTLRQAWL